MTLLKISDGYQYKINSILRDMKYQEAHVLNDALNRVVLRELERMLLGKNSDEFETIFATEFPEKVQELLEEIERIDDKQQKLIHELQDVKMQIGKLFEILCMGQRSHNRKDDHPVRPRDLKTQMELIFNAVEELLAEADQVASEQKVPYTPPVLR